MSRVETIDSLLLCVLSEWVDECWNVMMYNTRWVSQPVHERCIEEPSITMSRVATKVFSLAMG